MKLFITPDGTIRMIYADDRADVAEAIGETRSVRRVSDVEPETGEGGRVEWSADLARVGGPRLGPFATRKAALDAEVAWLEANALGGRP